MPFKYGNLIVGTFELVDGSVTTPKLADNAVTTSKVNVAAITNAKIAVDAVDTANIVDEAIATAKIALDAVDTDQIAAAAITTAKIGALQVTTALIDTAAITNAKIANLAVDNAKIQNMVADKILAGALGVSEFITSDNFVTGTSGWAIDGDGNAEFNDVTVRGAVEASTVSGSDISGGTIISDDTVDGERIKIQDGEILFLDIAGGSESPYAAITPNVAINSLRIQASNVNGIGGRLLLAERDTGGETSLRSFDGDVRVGADLGGDVYITSLGTPGNAYVQTSNDIELDTDEIYLDAGAGIFVRQNGTAKWNIDTSQDFPYLRFGTAGGIALFLENNGEETLSIEDNKVAAGRTLLRTSYATSSGSAVKLNRVAAGTATVDIRNTADGAYRAIRASAFTVSSDERVKRNIRNIDFSLSPSLRAKRYRREDGERDEIGFIAQDLPPELVEFDGDGEMLYNLPAMVALLWEEIRNARG